MIRETIIDFNKPLHEGLDYLFRKDSINHIPHNGFIYSSTYYPADPTKIIGMFFDTEIEEHGVTCQTRILHVPENEFLRFAELNFFACGYGRTAGNVITHYTMTHVSFNTSIGYAQGTYYEPGKLI